MTLFLIKKTEVSLNLDELFTFLVESLSLSFYQAQRSAFNLVNNPIPNLGCVFFDNYDSASIIELQLRCSVKKLESINEVHRHMKPILLQPNPHTYNPVDLSNSSVTTYWTSPKQKALWLLDSVFIPLCHAIHGFCQLHSRICIISKLWMHWMR